MGLARKAAETGYRTYVTTAADLAARCHRAAIEGRWATTMRFYAGPTCLVIDELGYLALPAEGASALFQVITQRYTKTSTIITSNRPITFWGQSWATPPWQQPCSTGSCTAPWSWTSAGTPTACGTTRPAQPLVLVGRATPAAGRCPSSPDWPCFGPARSTLRPRRSPPRSR